VLCDTY
jgi:glutamine synthetase